jgi:DNA-binding XRE family transcriptional regulator
MRKSPFSSTTSPGTASRSASRQPGAALAMGTPDAVDQVNVGRGLRTLRTGRGLSIRALAEKSGLNVNTLSLIENGKTSPSVHTLQQLAQALEMPINQPTRKLLSAVAASKR